MLTRSATPVAIAFFAAAAAASMALAADALPTRGCYQRAYEAAHLDAHKGQFVVKANLNIMPPTQDQLADKKWGIVANAELNVWVRGQKTIFQTEGGCSVKGNGLDCGAAISAAETEVCKTQTPGVTSCRVDLGDAGGFRIEARAEGVVVSIPKRVELTALNSDTGPYLNLFAGDKENSDFLLKPAGACE